MLADFGQIESKLKAGHALENQDVTRALEVAGFIGLMLSGAFPMVYLMNKHLSKGLLHDLRHPVDGVRVFAERDHGT